MFLTYGPLKVVPCSVDLIGITAKAVVGVVDHFGKHAKTILFGYSIRTGGLDGWLVTEGNG